MAEEKGKILSGAQVGEPVPVERRLDPHDEVFSKWLDRSQEAIRLGLDVAMQLLVPLAIKQAEIHLSGM